MTEKVTIDKAQLTKLEADRNELLHILIALVHTHHNGSVDVDYNVVLEAEDMVLATKPAPLLEKHINIFIDYKRSKDNKGRH